MIWFTMEKPESKKFSLVFERTWFDKIYRPESEKQIQMVLSYHKEQIRMVLSCDEKQTRNLVQASGIP